MDKKYILFDLDGTITDPKTGITKSVEYSLRSFGIHVGDLDELLPFIGPPLRDSYKNFYSFSDVDAEKAVAKYREYFTDRGIFENILYPGMDDLLQTLYEAGKTLAIATSKPEVFAKTILKHFDINKYFSFVSGSELDGRRSAKSEVIRYALDNLPAAPVGCAIMVGDRENDIIGAKAVGMDSIGVLYGYGSQKELEDCKADYIAKSVPDLLNLLTTKV